MAGKEYQMAFSIGAKLEGQFNSTFGSAKSSVQGLQNQIESLNKIQSNINSYQKTQDAITKTQAKLERYKAEYAALEAKIKTSGDASGELTEKLNEKGVKIDQTKDKLTDYEKKLESTGNALEKAGVDTQNLGEASQAVGSQIDELKDKQEALADASRSSAEAIAEFAGTIGLAAIVKKVGDAFQACAEEAIAFENAMAGVKRTVGGSDSFLNGLAADFQQLSTEIPITTGELASIATTAGQLGIAQQDVEQFTTVMAKLATTTDLTADDAATMLAQFANITGLTDYERLGSVIAELGDATATTASKVVQMSQGMAASASLAGMSATDIMAVSAAVGSLGIEAQAGSTAMSTLINTLYKATETGEKLEEFASVAGMTAEQFKKAWAEDAVGAMNSFIQGLNNVEQNGKSAIVILDELGITNVRQTKAILSLASAGDLLGNTIAQAGQAWESNTALTEKASVMYETTQAKLTMLQNAFANVQTAVGDAFTPAISGAANALTGLLQPMAQFIEQNPALVAALTGTIATIGVGTAGMAAFHLIATKASVALASFKVLLGGPVMKTILIVSGVVGALAAGFSLLNNTYEDTTATMGEMNEKFTDINEKIKEQNDIVSLADQYKKLSTQVDHTVDVVKDLEFNDIDISIGATAQETIIPDQFLIDGIHDITVTGDPQESVDANELLDENGNLIVVEGVADPDALLEPDELLAETDVNIEGVADPDALLDPDELVEGSEVPITGTVDETIDPELLVGDGAVQIDGAPGEKVNPDELVEDGAAEVDAKAGDTIEQQELVGKTGVTITATGPDESHKLDAEVFVNDKPFSLHAEWENYDAMVKQADELRTKASGAKSSLTEANRQYTELETYLSQLMERYNRAGTEGQKNSIQASIEAVTTAMSEQESKIKTLEAEYEQAGGEYLIVSSAANTLAEKNEWLRQTEEQLGISAAGTAESYEENKRAKQEAADAAAKLASANTAALKSELYQTITDQAATYKNTLDSAEESRRKLTAAENRAINAQEFISKNADDAHEAFRNILSDLDEMEGMELSGDTLDNYNAKLAQVQAYLELVTGRDVNMSQVSGAGIGWLNTYGDFQPNSAQWSQAIQDLTDDIGKFNTEVGEAEQSTQSYYDTLAQAVVNGTIEAGELQSRLEDAYNDIPGGAQIVAEAMEYVRSKLEDAAEGAEDYATAADKTKDESIAAAIQQQVAQIEALAEAYGTAYESAYKSISGVFDLFEEAKIIDMNLTVKDDGTVEATKDRIQEASNSVDTMIANLESQKAYIEQYQQNLESVKAMGLSQEIVTQLSDGSAESAQILADIAQGGADKIDALNHAFEGVDEGKQAFADTVANMETDFDAKMAEIEATLQSTVDSMNKSDEAAAAGAATAQAFADAAAGMNDVVAKAFSKLGKTAIANLYTKYGLSGYASGVTSAPPGFALVGEQGPELMYFNGGESVIDAQKTRAIMNRTSDEAIEPMQAYSTGDTNEAGNIYTIDFEPQYNITGSADADEIRTVLEEHDENLRQTLEDLLEDIQTDETRRKYA